MIVTKKKATTITTVAAAMLSAAIAFAPSAQAVEITYQQGVNGYNGNGGSNENGDNWAFKRESLSDHNNGHANNIVLSGPPQGDFRNTPGAPFAMSVWDDFLGSQAGQVPTGASVNSATLGLYGDHTYNTEGGNRNAPLSIQVYSWKDKVYPGLEDNAIPPHAGNPNTDPSEYGSTRGYRIHYTQRWNSPRYSGTPTDANGGDTTQSTPWDTYTIPGSEEEEFGPQWVNFDVTDVVQKWVDGTETNNGFALFSEDNDQYNGIVFHSAEYGSSASEVALRPKLTIDYAVPEPGTIALMSIGGALIFTGRRRRKA